MEKQFLTQQKFLMRGANPDEEVTSDGNTNPDEATIPHASTVVPEATQEPFTQSVKECQAP